jgi:aminopeptidase N
MLDSPLPGWPSRRPLYSQKWLTALAVLLAVLVFAGPGLADRPFAPARDYDLLHSTIRMSFDTAHRKLFGEVIHRISITRDGADRVTFDCVGLHIDFVALDGDPVQYELTPTQIVVHLRAPAHRGDPHAVEFRYDGSPRQGMFFILPDKNYPDRPVEIWTQGEAEDTRFYLPTYDYPNDRLTTDTYLVVPKGWETISNGRLASKSPAPGGTVVWHWVQDAPLSTYLISIVAGEFDHTSDTWRGIPLSYYAPRGRGDRIPVTFDHTRAMLDFFSATFGVPYPWPKYAQVAVDEFTEGGMENTSATTLAARALVNPALAAEHPMREDDLVSHELAHQWFGDLVTCRDWTNLWLNEGFATLAEYIWEEHEYGREEADFTRWNEARNWLADDRVYSVPIVNSNFTDSMQYAPNVYAKAGLVLYSLRQELGPAQFYAGLKHYLEKYRGRDVITADLITALDESTSHNVDRFFQQWIYGAGAPNLGIQYTYDDSTRQVRLEVKQVQHLEGAVGLFTLPTEVEITTASGAKRFPIVVSKQAETFSFPADGPPLLVLFDPGDTFLDSVRFDKSAREWLYQLRHAATVPDRADAAAVLGELPAQDPVSSALAESARSDPFWGVRVEALDSLAKIGGAPAREAMVAALEDSDPRVAATAATLLRIFPHDEKVAARLEVAVRGAKFYRTREAALISLGRIRSPNSFPVLLEALRTDSPDDGLRRAALIGFGQLSDSHAIPIVLDWAAPGRPLGVRAAAIRSLGVLDRGNPETTRRLLAYLDEPIAPIRRAALSALEQRSDASAIAPLEAVLSRGDLSDRLEASVRRVVAHLRKSEASSGAAAASPID